MSSSHSHKVIGPQVKALADSVNELTEQLEQAIRFIEVNTAYRGAMTAQQVENAIKSDFFPSAVEIGANSCNTLARFDFVKARAAVANAKSIKS